MKFYWLRIVLLATFVFWATGLAKYTHEALEHHGRDASIDDGDDDDDSPSPAVAVAVVVPPAPQATPQDPSHQPNKPNKPKHPCPVCQMLAAMVVDRSDPPALPPPRLELIERLVVADHIAPNIAAHFHSSARGPPVASL